MCEMASHFDGDDSVYVSEPPVWFGDASRHVVDVAWVEGPLLVLAERGCHESDRLFGPEGQLVLVDVERDDLSHVTHPARVPQPEQERAVVGSDVHHLKGILLRIYRSSIFNYVHLRYD